MEKNRGNNKEMKKINLQYEAKKVSNSILLPLTTALHDNSSDFSDIQSVACYTFMSICRLSAQLGIYEFPLSGKFTDLNSVVDKLEKRDYFDYYKIEDIKKIYNEIKEQFPRKLIKKTHLFKKYLIDI